MNDKYLHGVIHAVDVAPGYEHMWNVPNPDYMPPEKRKAAVIHGFGSYTLGSRSNLDGDVGADRSYLVTERQEQQIACLIAVVTELQQALERSTSVLIKIRQAYAEVNSDLVAERNFWRREAIQRGYRDGREDR